MLLKFLGQEASEVVSEDVDAAPSEVVLEDVDAAVETADIAAEVVSENVDTETVEVSKVILEDVVEAAEVLVGLLKVLEVQGQTPPLKAQKKK